MHPPLLPYKQYMNQPFLLALYNEISRDKQWVCPGLEAYFLVLDLLQSGKARPRTFDEMAFLLETLWLKSERHQERFRQLLERRRQGILEFIQWQQTQVDLPSGPGVIKPQEENHEPATPLAKEEQGPDPVAAEVIPPPVDVPVPAEAAPGPISFSLAGGNASSASTFSVQQQEQNIIPKQEVPFLFTNDYFPVKNRHLQQAWRSLKSYSTEGKKTDILDLPGTIKLTAQKGYFSDLRYQSAPDNRLHVFLFLDRGPGMIAVASFGKELWDTLPQHQQWPEPLYFYDLPRYEEQYNDYVLFTEDQEKDISLRRLFAGLHRKDIAVLIYSDAGALTNDDDPQRLEQTRQFMKHLYRYCARLSWINPAPAHRWADTNAGVLSTELPMFDTGRTEVEQAIAVLKGKFSIKK